MLVIRDLNTGKYFCKNNKVITFNDINKANYFINNFINFSMQKSMTEDPSLIFEIMQASSHFNIEELPQKYDFEIIDFDNIKP